MKPKQLKSQYQRSLLFAFFLIAVLNACSSLFASKPSAEVPEKNSKIAAPATKPSPKPEEPKPPEETWTCKVSNGEGRIFKIVEASRQSAEAKAKQDCQITYRHCFLLDCNPGP